MGLKSQINPHVLFNSLNSLSGLIQEDTDQAEKFLDEMSKVYRYMLRNEEEPLVPLQTELQFIQSYFSLLKARYNEAIAYEIDLWQEDLEKQVPPLSLQVIVENAIFQNRISRDSPLIIRIESVRGGALVVSNNIQRKLMTEPFDYEAGVDNLVKKYQLMNQPPIEIKEEEGLRKIRLPFITQTEEVA
jgi:LytS/YehU family sensor histidine kinase